MKDRLQKAKTECVEKAHFFKENLLEEEGGGVSSYHFLKYLCGKRIGL